MWSSGGNLPDRLALRVVTWREQRATSSITRRSQMNWKFVNQILESCQESLLENDLESDHKICCHDSLLTLNDARPSAYCHHFRGTPKLRVCATRSQFEMLVLKQPILSGHHLECAWPDRLKCNEISENRMRNYHIKGWFVCISKSKRLHWPLTFCSWRKCLKKNRWLSRWLLVKERMN